MPTAAKRACHVAGCAQTQPCPTHPRHLAAGQTYADRVAAEPWRRLYHTARWRKARVRFLREHPLCVECQAEGRVVAAKAVDHRIPHRGDLRRFWDEGNWQGLCHRHHGAKTAGETLNGGRQ
jgi:5-methylcytosine-specific restriction protein A